MSLFVPRLSAKAFVFDNWGANPSATPGTSVTPGASNAEGSWTQVATSGNIAQDIYGLYVVVGDGRTAGASKPHLLDIGVDPAGGSSYTPEISNLACGCTTINDGARQQFFFPYFIKSGSSVAVRIQGANATAGTVRVGTRFYGQQSRPETFPVGTYSETLGTITNSNGVSFTPGNAADGSWVSLGTTAKPLWWWQLGYQIDNSTITAEYTYIELAVGDGSNKHVIQRVMHGGTTNETVGSVIDPRSCWFESYHPVPAGAELFVRGRCNNAPDTGYNAVAIGIGG